MLAGQPADLAETERQRAEIMRIMQEEERVEAEHVRRELELAIREAENARVISEHLRKLAEESRQAMNSQRSDRIKLNDIEAMILQQGKVLDRLIASLRREREEDNDWNRCR